MKIGLLGGTFDPIHNGHLAIAQAVLEKYALDKIIFVPCGIPPHKPPEDIQSAQKRFQMVDLVVKQKPRFEISDYEISRKGPSYTIHTVRYIRRTKGIEKKNLFFIIGADSLYDLHTWKQIDTLVTLCEFAVVYRKGFRLREISAEDLKLKESTFRACMKHSIMMDPVDVSASKIRRKVAAGESINGMVPEPVEIYIHQHALYNKP